MVCSRFFYRVSVPRVPSADCPLHRVNYERQLRALVKRNRYHGNDLDRTQEPRHLRIPPLLFKAIPPVRNTLRNLLLRQGETGEVASLRGRSPTMAGSVLSIYSVPEEPRDSA